MSSYELEVQGMTCGNCVAHVTKALKSVAGVGHVEVDLAQGRAHVDGDLPGGANALILALTAEGYPAQLATGIPTVSTSQPGGCHSSASGKGCCCG
jgi:copper chaperone CopZ